MGSQELYIDLVEWNISYVSHEFRLDRSKNTHRPGEW